MYTISLNSISKIIKDHIVLKDINLSLQSGKIYGFIGKNGSGKTMLFRMISGLIRPSSGTIMINEKVLYKDVKNMPSIGILIENISLYPEFTGFQNLKYLASIRNTISDKDIKNSIERVGLNPDDKRTVKKYSLGMRQRIVLAQAIMEKPDILLLDEPTNGLDAEGVLQIRNIIQEEANRGALVLLASHNQEDINSLCDICYQLESGEIK